MNSEQEKARRAGFKKTLDDKEGRRRREETTRQIRKNKREENIAKRRQMTPAPSASTDITATGSDIDKSQRKLGALEDIPELTRMLTSPTSSDEEKVEATRGFRRILSVERNPPVDEVLAAGVLPFFVHNLTADPVNSKMVFESAWALTNIASTTQTPAVVEGGAVPPLITLLRHENADVREQATWCLGNIAGDNREFRDYLLKEGIVAPLVLNIEQPATMSLLNNMVWALSNLCRGKPVPDLALLAPAIGPLTELLYKDVSVEVLVDAVWALSYLSDGDNDRIGAVMTTGVADRLVQFLGPEMAPQMLTPVVRCLGNFATGSDSQTQAVVDAGILKHFVRLLENPKKGIRKETCWVASNIAAGTQDQITALITQPGVIEKIADYARNASWEVKKEALWTISNCFTTGTDDHTMMLVQCEALRPLADVLATKNADATVLCACLDAIEHVLNVSDRQGLSYGRVFDEYQGIESLENLQEHPSDQVYNKTIKIIETHFNADEEEDENLAPTTTDSGTFAFGAPSPKQLFSTPAQPMTFAFGQTNRAF
eukprot:CAMPEP_0117055134 /NCGR_PEP_ID=MMETSP0472-20121206/38213_1 /TAXON_ID=693140 ORGANISM="Tiarina fusus, Strain LIS" /NCGR_SAMPLE_ID=MMETSP0472 /ASSEMBLY_ACC=CAM_ASM_000603 /LENGTH=544 /DNA_ID=CAMNT_0004770997 /DNA_START=55 /DNA_END=1689 /DNA_ORIENTATION=+